METNNLPNNLNNYNDLVQENELLLDQLHIAQEKIENLYNKISENENKYFYFDNDNLINNPKIYNIIEENLKLKALTIQLKELIKVKENNCLTVRLGEMLIQGVSSIRSFIVLPFKLCITWKNLIKKNPPSKLGGKNFQNVIEVYTKGGIKEVENLLNSVSISNIMRANAYTALAKYLIHTDIEQSANFAKLAWQIDPQIYRLKWMAFRIHEAKDPITAEALLNIYPNKIIMNTAEQNHAARIRFDSKNKRNQLAKERIKEIQDEYITTNNFSKNIKHELQNKELNKLKTELNNVKQLSEQYHKDLELSYTTQKKLHNKVENLEQEYKNLTIYIATIIKALIIKFESNQQILSQIINIISRIPQNR